MASTKNVTREPGVFVDKEGVTRKAEIRLEKVSSSGNYASMSAVVVVVVLCCVSISASIFFATKSSATTA